jgi:hypothetical protein
LGPFFVGGARTSTFYDRFAIQVSSPPNTYNLNHTPVTTLDNCTLLDYSHDIDVTAGADLTLTADSGDDLVQLKNLGANGQPIASPPGVEPSEGPFNGQFMQVDVTSVAIGP